MTREPVTHVRRDPLPWRPPEDVDTECGKPAADFASVIPAVEAERRHLIGLEDVARVWPASPVDGWLPERRERAFAALLWAIRETRERIEAWETDRSVEATTPRGEAA